MKSIYKSFIVTVLFAIFFFSPQAFAQDSSVTTNTEMLMAITIGVIIIIILTLIVLIYYLVFLNRLLAKEMPEAEKKPGWWSVMIEKLTRRVPLEQESQVLMDHDYDGIQELDNHLPPWWKYLFYLTIAFAVVYVFVYHVFKTAPLQIEEYEIAMEDARLKLEARQAALGEVLDETNVEFTDDATALANGKSIFETTCSPCHMNDGGGGIGPNLTDQYWINGGSLKDIFTTIKYGVPEKGMISWQSQLPATSIRDVASYITTLRGTTPQNPKAPEGDLYEPEE